MSETTAAEGGYENSSTEGTRVQAALLANSCEVLLKGHELVTLSPGGNDPLEMAIGDMTNAIAKPEDPFEAMISAHCSTWEKYMQ